MSFRILNTIGEIYTEEAKDILKKVGNVDYKNPTQEELENIVSEYDILVVGLGLNMNKSVLENATNLKIIATATTGLDHIDIKMTGEKNIKVLSLKGENEFLDTITGTAELALGLMIDLVRKMPSAIRSVEKGVWDREKFRGNSLYRKTLGVLGLGRLGKMMARYGNALGMRVIYTDPEVEEKKYPDYQKVSFDDLLSQSDILSIHVHLKEDTENLFNKETFSKMKTGVFLINTSRDRIVDEGDLIEAIRTNKLGGYATDVLSGEVDFGKSIPPGHSLHEYSKINDRVIIVPHIGGMTVESRRDTDVFIAKKIAMAVKEN